MSQPGAASDLASPKSDGITHSQGGGIPASTISHTAARQLWPGGPTVDQTAALVDTKQWSSCPVRSPHQVPPGATAAQPPAPVSAAPISMSLPWSPAGTSSLASDSSPSVSNRTPRRRHGDKGGAKGLRLFSCRVCEKIREKQESTYSEIANELVRDERAQLESAGPKAVPQREQDERNIHRRVYDVLNVLQAAGVVGRDNPNEKKRIQWKGFPTRSALEATGDSSAAAATRTLLEEERRSRIQSLEAKRQQIQELLLETISYHNLVQRNGGESVADADALLREHRGAGTPVRHGAGSDGHTHTSAEARKTGVDEGQGGISELIDDVDLSYEGLWGATVEHSGHLPLHFVCVATKRDTDINCCMSEDHESVRFTFNKPFTIYNDFDILKFLNMHTATPGVLQQIIPPELLPFLSHIHPNVLPQGVATLPALPTPYPFVPNAPLPPELVPAAHAPSFPPQLIKDSTPATPPPTSSSNVAYAAPTHSAYATQDTHDSSHAATPSASHADPSAATSASTTTIATTAASSSVEPSIVTAAAAIASLRRSPKRPVPTSGEESDEPDVTRAPPASAQGIRLDQAPSEVQSADTASTRGVIRASARGRSRPVRKRRQPLK